MTSCCLCSRLYGQVLTPFFILFFVRPDYIESAVFGRKLINESLYKIMSTSILSSRSEEARSLLEDETQSLLTAYLRRERSRKVVSPEHKEHLKMLSELAKDLLQGYNNLEDEQLMHMAWLCPVLTSCIQAHDPAIRKLMQMVMDRVLKGDDSNGKVTDQNAEAAQAMKPEYEARNVQAYR